MATVKRPFCFAVADDEAPGSHFLEVVGCGEGKYRFVQCCVGISSQIGCVIAIRAR